MCSIKTVFVLLALLLTACATEQHIVHPQKIYWQHVEVEKNAQGKIVMRSVLDEKTEIVIRTDNPGYSNKNNFPQ